MEKVKLEYATVTVYQVGNSEVEMLSVDNVRMDYIELTDNYLKFRDLDELWYVIPMDTLLYYTFKITE